MFGFKKASLSQEKDILGKNSSCNLDPRQVYQPQEEWAKKLNPHIPEVLKVTTGRQDSGPQTNHHKEFGANRNSMRMWSQTSVHSSKIPPIDFPAARISPGTRGPPGLHSEVVIRPRADKEGTFNKRPSFHSRCTPGAAMRSWAQCLSPNSGLVVSLRHLQKAVRCHWAILGPAQEDWQPQTLTSQDMHGLREAKPLDAWSNPLA